MAASSSKTAAVTVKSKLDQNELRRLMKEKQDAMKTKGRQIDSPLAKYNNLGQLFCVVCNIQIKNELVWPAHINGKSHRQNINTLKSQKAAVVIEQSPVARPVAGVKRQIEPQAGNASDVKKAKSSTEATLPSDFFDDKPKSHNQEPVFKVPIIMSAIMEEEEKFDEDDIRLENELQPTQPLPDSKDVDSQNTVVDVNVNKTVGLPEGFFDDPVQDAKIRKVEYKDPVEEEWERFQREIADATSKAQAIADEEEEESTVDRQIDEIDEQIYNWARVDNLQRKKEELAKEQKINNMKEDDDDASVDEQEFQEFLDWRAKRCWR